MADFLFETRVFRKVADVSVAFISISGKMYILYLLIALIKMRQKCHLKIHTSRKPGGTRPGAKAAKDLRGQRPIRVRHHMKLDTIR